MLVADNGSSETVNLFGLDLIHSDNGSETRTMLADGLGTVRTEMVGANIETVSTYEPRSATLRAGYSASSLSSTAQAAPSTASQANSTPALSNVVVTPLAASSTSAPATTTQP